MKEEQQQFKEEVYGDLQELKCETRQHLHNELKPAISRGEEQLSFLGKSARTQTEVYRTRFRSRVRARGEPLQQLAHDLESMAHKAYPGAAPNMLVILLRDQFIDVLDTGELKVQVKQAQPRNMQEALARALEFESYVRSSTNTYARSNFPAGHSTGFKARKGQVCEVENFEGSCWYCRQPGHKKEDCFKWQREQGKIVGGCWFCGNPGHKREDCYKLRKEQEQGSTRKSTFAPRGCWTCGERGHFSVNCQNKRKEDMKAAEDKERSGKLVKAGEKGLPPAGISQVAPSLRRCKRTAIDSVRVDVRIDRKKFSLVIDLASEQTFARPDVLHHRYLPESSEQLCGVTGHCLNEWTPGSPDRSGWARGHASSLRSRDGGPMSSWPGLSVVHGIVSSSFDSNLGVVEPDVRSKTNAEVMVGRTLLETSGGEVPVVVAISPDVEEWRWACDVCCAKKGPKKRGCAPLQLYQVGAPMERVTVDIAGPLPCTDKGNRYICVAMDYFTKWP
ncbi:hypothetical protein Pcinc_010562 [Petrolisthes cinctipes]|uniref:CCHC-type domain-containing protein n=1 Tax=Petrolisthes cinctipes TaxID=88211 RepID=A0AAE1KV97_PETCI|nr:hypothetical protein Pcinc_010562 [Petrolisthes cinctipes]